MEKGFEENINIAITGPESTAKSSITGRLSQDFSAIGVHEYARAYVMDLNRDYRYEDVEHIAKYQLKIFKLMNQKPAKLVFYDTWLIITKIWFLEVFGKYPDWMDEAIDMNRMDFYLVCSPDIAWKKDTVRENGGIKRMELFHKYIDQIESLDAEYAIIKGSGDERFDNAYAAVNDFLIQKKELYANGIIKK